MLTMTIGLLIFGVLLLCFGAYMVYLGQGQSSNTELEFFGAKVTTTHVGVVVCVVAAAMIFLGFGQIHRTVGMATDADIRREAPNTPSGSQTLTTNETRIVIHLSGELQRQSLKFFLLQVRNGKDEVPGAGPPLNKEIEFSKIDDRGNLEAIVRTPANSGFQFKCFVHYAPLEFQNVKKLLEEAGFDQISEGGGRSFRAWFLIKNYPVYTTKDGFVNNFYYPS